MNNKLFLIILIVLFVIGGWYLLSTNISAPGPKTTNTGTEPNGAVNIIDNNNTAVANTNTSTQHTCRLQCTGVYPGPNADQDCQQHATKEQCEMSSFTDTNTGVSFSCIWVPADYQCPPLP